MANITQYAEVSVSATIEFNECELRALDAMVGYGIEPFLKVFYSQLGTAYMKPHEKGLRSIFKSIQSHVPAVLHRANDVKLVFSGDKIAVSKPPAPEGV